MELKMLSVPSLEAFGPDGPPMTRNVLAQTSGTRQRSSWPSAVPTTRGGAQVAFALSASLALN